MLSVQLRSILGPELPRRNSGLNNVGGVVGSALKSCEKKGFAAGTGRAPLGSFGSNGPLLWFSGYANNRRRLLACRRKRRLLKNSSTRR